MYKFGMLCFILAASVVVRNDAAKMTEGQKSKIYALLLTGGMECMRDFPLTLDHINQFRNKKVPDDEGAKCFTYCLFKRLGMMDDTGKMSEKKAKKTSRKVFKEGDEMLTKIDDIIGKCVHVNDAETSDGDKGCDRAKLLMECLVEHATEIGLDAEIMF